MKKPTPRLSILNSKSGKAKDTPKSVLNSVINRIPFASQQLPRKAGVAAKDLFDRVTKGDRETDTSKLAKVDAKKEVDRAKDFAARDIPDYKADYPKRESFDKAVQARFESREYDKAIEGLQSELDSKKNNKNIPNIKSWKTSKTRSPFTRFIKMVGLSQN